MPMGNVVLSWSKDQAGEKHKFNYFCMDVLCISSQIIYTKPLYKRSVSLWFIIWLLATFIFILFYVYFFVYYILYLFYYTYMFCNYFSLTLVLLRCNSGGCPLGRPLIIFVFITGTEVVFITGTEVVFSFVWLLFLALNLNRKSSNAVSYP